MIKDKKQKSGAESLNWKKELQEWTVGIIFGLALGPLLFHFLTFMREPMIKWFEFMLAAVFYRIVIRRKTFYLPKEAKEWIEVIVFAGFLAFNIRVFAVQAYKIPSGSMIPTFQVGDHLFVSKFNYWFKMPVFRVFQHFSQLSGRPPLIAVAVNLFDLFKQCIWLF